MSLWKLDGLQQTSDDLNRKYGGTYVILQRDTKQPRLAYVDSIGEKIYCRNRSGGAVYGYDIDSVKMIQEYPKVGWFQKEGQCFFLNTLPARQWQRGLCVNNSRIYQDPLAAPIRFAAGIGWDIAEAAFNPLTTVTLADGLKAIRNKEFSGIALTKKYALKKQGDSIALYRNTAPIGNFVGHKFFFEEASVCLKAEVNTDLGV